MTGLPDNNSGNDFIRGLETRACVNGMTKSDVERLKNALVKKILDDETVIEITEDGGIVADSDGLFIKLNGQQLGLSIDGEDIIPVTEPYLPEDENENPLAPPNDTIMTSANIAVDPRIVRTIGNQEISGTKTFASHIKAPMVHSGYITVGISASSWYKIYEFTPVASSQNCVIDVVNNWALAVCIDCTLRINIPAYNSSDNPKGWISNGDALIGKIAKTSTGKYEVWLTRTAGSSGYAFNGKWVTSLIPVPVGTSGSEPVQGDDYPVVVDLTVIS